MHAGWMVSATKPPTSSALARKFLRGVAYVSTVEYGDVCVCLLLQAIVRASSFVTDSVTVNGMVIFEDSAAVMRCATTPPGAGRARKRPLRAQGPRCAELVLLAAMLSSAETGEDRAEPLIAETGIESVLIVSDCFPPPAYDMALCLAYQYKLAMDRVGIATFHDWRGSQAGASDTKELAEFVWALRPDLVLYIPELELPNRLPNISHLWQASQEFGIPTAVMLTHLHPGLTINLAEPLWHARYVISADPAALAHWTSGSCPKEQVLWPKLRPTSWPKEVTNLLSTHFVTL